MENKGFYLPKTTVFCVVVHTYWIHANIFYPLVYVGFVSSLFHWCFSSSRTSSILSKDHPPDKKPKSDKTSLTCNEFDPTGNLHLTDRAHPPLVFFLAISLCHIILHPLPSVFLSVCTTV